MSYANIWDQYWGDITAQTGAALWDVAPDNAAARDLEAVREHFPDDRVMIDLGCGNGTQTVYLGQHYSRVLGVDISEVVIDAVQSRPHPPAVSYRQFDLLNEDACTSLWTEIGDAHVYVRGVIHQLERKDWAQAVAGIRTLIGSTATALIVELGAAAHGLMARIHEPPPKLAEVLAHGIVPAALGPGAIEELFGGFEVLAHGETAIHTTQPLPDGSRLTIPAEYWALRTT